MFRLPSKENLKKYELFGITLVEWNPGFGMDENIEDLKDGYQNIKNFV